MDSKKPPRLVRNPQGGWGGQSLSGRLWLGKRGRELLDTRVTEPFPTRRLFHLLSWATCPREGPSAGVQSSKDAYYLMVRILGKCPPKGKDPGWRDTEQPQNIIPGEITRKITYALNYQWDHSEYRALHGEKKARTGLPGGYCLLLRVGTEGLQPFWKVIW